MFNHHYFGQAYTGQSYFPDGIGDVALMSQQVVTSAGSYAPIQSAYGMAGYVRSDDGSYSVIVTSRGAP